MEVPRQKINIDINSGISQSVCLIKNINDSGTRFVDVCLFADSQAFDVSNNTAKATFVINGFLAAEDVSCTINGNIVTVPIDKISENAVHSGIMLIQIKLIDSNNNIIVTPVAFKVRVTPHIIYDAKVSEKSLGTVAEVIKEVALARGNFENLAAAIANKIDNTSGSVKSQNIAAKAVTMSKLGDDVAATIAAKADRGEVYSKTEVYSIPETERKLATKLDSAGRSVHYENLAEDVFGKIEGGNTKAVRGTDVYLELSKKADKDEGGGVAGADGKSAYEIAIENGFNGTEAQWLASLKGSDGTNGSNGIGIEYADINNNGDLILFYSDGTQENLGVVVGADGTNGKDGKDGQDYVLTDADKQEIANLSADTVPKYIRTAAETVANKVLSVTGEANAEGSSVGYTNQLLRATDESGNLYNNGKGYKTDYRLNSSGMEKNDYTGVCCTGFISCKAGDIIRFKNVTVASSTVTAYIAKYDTDKAFVSVSSATNDIIENSYTVAGSSTAYVRFSLGQITDNSIITVNEEISESVSGKTAKSVVPFNLAFITDLHYNDTQIGRYTAAKKAMDVINEIAPIDVEIMGGDYCNNYTATSGGTANEAREDISNCKKMFSDSRRRLWLRGNHDSNGYPNERLPKAEIYNRIFRSQHTINGFVENPADPYGCYGYMDFDNAKIRLIVVNTSDNDSFGTATPEQSTHTAPMINSHNIGAKQLQWIADTALNFSGKDDVADWGVIFVSHVPIYNTNSWYNSHTYTDDSGKNWDCNLINLVNLVTAYKNKTAFTCSNNGETVSKDFSSNTAQAKILCFISGHTHALTNTTYNGFNIISCPNANGGANVSTNGISYAKSNIGSVGETALSVISIDRSNKKIHAFCYGAGYDREIEI